MTVALPSFAERKRIAVNSGEIVLGVTTLNEATRVFEGTAEIESCTGGCHRSLSVQGPGCTYRIRFSGSPFRADLFVVDLDEPMMVAEAVVQFPGAGESRSCVHSHTGAHHLHFPRVHIGMVLTEDKSRVTNIAYGDPGEEE